MKNKKQNDIKKRETIEKDLGDAEDKFPMDVVTNKLGYLLYDAKKTDNTWTGKRCDDPSKTATAEEGRGTKVSKVNNKDELFKYCKIKCL
jgi:hypothetical protein